MNKEEIVLLACRYCGTEPANGLAMKDGRCGPVEGNVVPCCEVCRRMKMNRTEQEFLDQIRRIVGHRGGRV